MIWDVIAGAFILAIIMMLVKPNSPAAGAVVDVSDALTALISASIGNTPPKAVIKRAFGNTSTG